jgi:NAD-dependent SIR2 family protein deacetylase
VTSAQPANGQAPSAPIVWFGEMPLQVDAIYAALNDVDLFVAIGTSARSTPPQDLCMKRERSAFAPVKLIWSHPITLISLTRGGMDLRVRQFMPG